MEGLRNELGKGPCNDAQTIATIYVERGYKVFYFCDAIASEYRYCLIIPLFLFVCCSFFLLRDGFFFGYCIWRICGIFLVFFFYFEFYYFEILIENILKWTWSSSDR
jgi:hypothetical protein